MKSYLTEEDNCSTASPSKPSRSLFRQPLKLLQNLQHCQNSIISKMSASSTALKSITNRQKRTDSTTTAVKNNKLLDVDSQISKSKTTTATSRQRNAINTRTNVKSPSTVQNKPNDTKNKLSDSASGTVGSLTSSPKWSHIKNKFENGSSMDKTKLSRTESLKDEDNVSSKSSFNATKSSTFLLPETKLTASKVKNSAARKSETNNVSLQSKYDNSLSSKIKSKDELTLSKDKNFKPSSPKSSFLHSSRNISNSKSNNPTSKYSQLNTSTCKQAPQSFNGTSKSSRLQRSLAISSVSLSSSSSKNSEADDTHSNSSIKSCNSPNNSQISIPSSSGSNTKRSHSPKPSLLTTTRSSSPKNSQLNISSENVSSLHNGLNSKRNVLAKKVPSSTISKKDEDVPKFKSNQGLHNQSDQIEPARKSFLSEKDRLLLHNISNINKSCKINSATATKHNSEITDTDISLKKSTLSDNTDKIKELVKSSPPSSKTIWVKDKAGNWVKKTDTELKPNIQSKVASLRSKYLGPSKETTIPLAKCITENPVPSKTPIRTLAKSSTTSSICDRTLIEDISSNLGNCLNGTPNSQKPKNLNGNAVIGSKVRKRNSVDSDAKLNIVQRAILSYEGNLALLSPESQRRLKLVNEKVQAQTDDDKILQSKVHTSSSIRPNKESSSKKSPNINAQKRPLDQKVVGDPIMPTREFLHRYQNMNKDIKKTSKAPESKVPSKNIVAQTTHTSFSCKDTNLTTQVKVETSNSSVSSSKVSAPCVEKSRQNLIVNVSESKTCHTTGDSNDEKSSAVLQPNSSFLWRCSTVTSSELSKSSTTSSVSLTSSDYRNYFGEQNYYSTLDVEIDKRSEISDDPIYIDSQESNSSENNYATSNGTYENVQPRTESKSNDQAIYEDWSDISDDEFKDNFSSHENSTVKKKKNNKRSISNRENSQMLPKVSNPSDIKKKIPKDTFSFTDSNDTLINDEVHNESTFELSDSSHFYEPVYESLGNYLRSPVDGVEDDNCSISLSPDDKDNGDFHCSMSSLESAESSKPEQEDNHVQASTDLEKNSSDKKSSNKISQLRRHLSWTKSDIRLELSSKFNKIKIKKNDQNSTEIGLKVQEHESANTSPKKKTFIKCILRQKSSSSIPVKRSPSPKKESAMFYVHLSMGSAKQRPSSDSVIANDASKALEESVLQKPKKQSEPSLQFNTKCGQQRPRYRKVASGPTVQRPKTPPPLPPSALASNKSSASSTTAKLEKAKDVSLENEVFSDVDSCLYTCLDPDFFKSEKEANSIFYENDVFQPACKSKNNSTSTLISKENGTTNGDEAASSSKRPTTDNLKLPLFPDLQAELLKSPFEEEPMYQFYQKDVQQRATLWFSADGSESDFEDDASSKFSDTEYQPVLLKPPVLQSQLSAMDLVHGEGGQRTLWCEVPEVRDSGILKTISSKERKIQEAMFEVITSEASYLKSLNFLFEHFVQCPDFSGENKTILDKRERHVLFSDIQPVRDVSAKLLADLEKRWLENIVLSNICDIIYHHASNYFSVYVKYCSNQLYQERLLRELKEKRPEFVSVLKRLESNPVCQGLDMHSFLMLPMQRITRLPLLIDAIFHRLSTDLPIHDSCKMALATVNKLVAQCNEGARKMERMEEMLVISQQLDFSDCKGLGLLSASRYLVKKGELVQLLLDNSTRRTFGRSSRWCKIQLYLFLFTDLLVVTRKKSDDSYSVIDFCPRNMLQVLSVDDNMPPLPMRLPSSYRNLFQIIMLNNREGKTVEMLLSCLLESDRTRWMDAMTPVKSENPGEKIYEEWDWPQFQCTHAYNAKQPDELSLEEADVVNVLRKMADGWFEGERIRDGVRGWFPSSHAVEIITSHVRARNLRQRYRLLMLSQTYLEEQYKVQALNAKK